MAEVHNWVIDQGSTFDETVEYVDGNDAIIPLTDYSARMQLRSDPESATVALSLTEGSGLTTNGAAGSVRIVISAAASAAMTAGSYVYDLEVFNVAGNVTRLIQGTITFTREITR